MPNRSLISLNWLNLFVAQMQTGFGAFLSVYLTTHGWTGTEIGFALSLGAIAAMVAQVPAGLLVDAMHSKPHAAGAAILAIMCAAMVIGVWPLPVPVLAAEILQGAASSMLGPAIAAITLALANKDVLGERLGLNMRYAAIGSFVAATAMGSLGTWYSHRAILFLAAACGVAGLLMLRGIRPEDLAAAPSRTDHRAAIPKPARITPHDTKWQIACDHCLLTFTLCVALFHLGNAGMLPIVANALTRSGQAGTDLIIAAAIVVPQALAALLSPHIGRLAERIGRRPVLLAGFAALVARGVLLATDGNPFLMIGFQALDGISAAVVGVMVPLVVADLTHRRGRFNLAMGIVGLGMGIGAALSTTLAGAIVDRYGEAATFLSLAAAGALACLLTWLILPETAHRSRQPLLPTV